eukprot:gene32961-55521_t
MAKQNMIQREKKRQKLITKFLAKRKELKRLFNESKTLEEKFAIGKKFQKLPRNSAPIRFRNRCWKTGRPRGYFRFFGLCRNALRELANDCFLPGITKAS